MNRPWQRAGSAQTLAQDARPDAYGNSDEMR